MFKVLPRLSKIVLLAASLLHLDCRIDRGVKHAFALRGEIKLRLVGIGHAIGEILRPVTCLVLRDADQDHAAAKTGLVRKRANGLENRPRGIISKRFRLKPILLVDVVQQIKQFSFELISA